MADEVEIVGLTDREEERPLSPVSKCSVSSSTTLRQATTSVLFSAVSRRTRSREVRFSAKPGTIHPHTKFKGQVYVLTERRRRPSYARSSPTIVLSSISEPLTLPAYITLPEGVDMCTPGDNVDMDVELITPIAIEEGLRFAIREGGRTVGSGVCFRN